MRLILLGPPGAGKGTQAKLISSACDVAHISTGDMLRERIAAGTPTGKQAKPYYDRGELVPDPIMVAMVRERLEELDCRNGFLLDGFPRTVGQAQALDEALARAGQAIELVLQIEVSDDELVHRLSGRRICQQCGKNYHLQFMPPKEADKCDNCGATLILRKDDQPETVRQRLAVYHAQTEPVAEHYRAKNLLVTVDGRKSVEEVSKRIRQLIETRLGR